VEGVSLEPEVKEALRDLQEDQDLRE